MDLGPSRSLSRGHNLFWIVPWTFGLLLPRSWRPVSLFGESDAGLSIPARESRGATYGDSAWGLRAREPREWEPCTRKSLLGVSCVGALRVKAVTGLWSDQRAVPITQSLGGKVRDWLRFSEPKARMNECNGARMTMND